MPDREKVIKGLECRKNANKRCENPCERTGMCNYAKAVHGLDGEIYYPYVCDKERLIEDALSLLKEQEAVVRCRDCKKLEICCIRREDNPDWFCAEGKRK